MNTRLPTDVFRELFVRAPDGILLVGDDGMVQMANPEAVRLLGYADDDITGMSVDELVPDSVREHHAEYRSGFFERPRMRPMGSGLSLSARRADHSLLPVEISLSPIDLDGRTMAVAVLRDVTERRATDRLVTELRATLEDRVSHLESLNRELEAYRVLITSAPDAVLLVTPEGVIELANPEASVMFGYSPDELKGMAVDDLVPRSVRHLHAAHREEFVTSPRKRPMGSGLDLEAQRADGTTVPVEISLSPVESEGTHMVLALVRDVSERRRSAETIRELTQSLAARVRHLESLNTELESFSYSVSHDLRAPLRALDGFSLAVLEDYGDVLDEDGRDYLTRIRGAAQRMARLIDDLLQLSRISRAELHRESVSVSDMAGLVSRELARADSGREVTVEIDPGLHMNADPHLLRLVLDNLIGNAWKFTSKQRWAHVRVFATEFEGRPAICIEDNGAGFDPEYAGRMFAAFQRMHPASEYPGTGIGLAIVQRIVTRHGGRILGEGQPGEGARFTFTLEPPPAQEAPQ